MDWRLCVGALVTVLIVALVAWRASRNNETW
jgi:hypothetical protein